MAGTLGTSGAPSAPVYGPIMSEGRLNGKVTIITGAAGGIGRESSLRFAQEGAAVVAVDLPGPMLDETVEMVTAAGGRCVAAAADVTDETQVREYVAAAVAEFGGVDALLNNAGIEGPITPLTDTEVAGFDRVLAVNVRGVFLGMKHVAPHIAARGGGAIVNVSSVAGLGGTPGIVAYGASKHAVIGMTKTAAMEFAPLKIRVNAVCPSPVETRMMRALEAGMNPEDPEAVRAMMAMSIPLGRYGEPSDIAALMCFLCSDEAAFLSGAAIPIDGGMRAR
jgi:NAD(P)-dependent dehydrogenase (short-subunit alcohol dehydrogenase family)